MLRIQELLDEKILFILRTFSSAGVAQTFQNPSLCYQSELNVTNVYRSFTGNRLNWVTLSLIQWSPLGAWALRLTVILSGVSTSPS